MYIDKDMFGKYGLFSMSGEDLRSLGDMIQGASIEDRRRFHPVLAQIRKEVNHESE